MPEEQPLQGLASLQLVFEAKNIVLVLILEEVKQLGGCFHHGEGRGFGMIEKDRYTTIGIET